MATSTTSPSGRRRYRLDAIDVLRGLVIVIMAIDHVRDYTVANAPLDPLADPNVAAGMFFTRWITHYCAPVFVTLAGVSAGLMTARKSRSELGLFLLTRGLWLVVVEFDRRKGMSSDFILKHVRAGKAEFVAELAAAGFEPIKAADPQELKENFFAELRRVERDGKTP